MPNNYTENYHLSQWERSDKVLHTDFNEDNRKIDEALSELAGTLDKKADASALSAASSSQAADKAELTSMISLRNCRVVTQTYTGSGSSSKTLTFAGKPFIVHVMGMESWVCAIQGSPKCSARYVNGGGGQLANAVWSGNSLTVTAPNTDPTFMCNWNGERYYVVAVIETA